MMALHMSADPLPAVHSLKPAIPPAVSDVIARMLDKRPAWRFASVDDAAQAWRKATA